MDSASNLEQSRVALKAAKEELAGIDKKWHLFGKSQKKETAEASVRKSQADFTEALREFVLELATKWQARDFSLMWAMQRLEDCLLQVGPSQTLPELSEMPYQQTQNFKNLLGRICLNAIQPKGTERLRALKIMFIGSQQNRQFLEINERDVGDALLDKKTRQRGLEIAPCEAQDQHMLSYLFIWLPSDGQPMPRYCTIDSDDSNPPASVSADLQAWPDDLFPVYHLGGNGSNPRVMAE